jgi:hypothetical protein
MAEELFCWPDALVELPDSPADAVSMIHEIVSDGHRENQAEERA